MLRGWSPQGVTSQASGSHHFRLDGGLKDLRRQVHLMSGVCSLQGLGRQVHIMLGWMLSSRESCVMVLEGLCAPLCLVEGLGSVASL